MVFIIPERCAICWIIGVPILVLGTRNSVHVQSCVDTILGTEIHHAVKVFEAGFLDNAGVQVVFQVAVIEGKTEEVQT